MQAPKVSILMPVYNAAPWLAACIESILAQSFQDWELIAIDDFSTDGSLHILQDFAKASPRIKVYSNKEKGIIAALRLAFTHSKGEYITRMDADDRMAPHKLFLLVKCLLAKGRGYVATGLVKYFSEQALGEGYRRYEEWLNTLCKANNHYRDIYRECVIPSPCWMVHREDLLHCGAYLPNRYPEDYDLCFRFYQSSLQILCVKEVLHFWRDHPQRSSRTDPNYASTNYFDLKLYWFLQIDRRKERPLLLWGAGKKGKEIARSLIAQAIPFTWLSNNPRKVGLQIYGIPIVSFTEITQQPLPQIIVAVSAPNEQNEIRNYWETLGEPGDLYFFC
ncbi:MAG TPA: glycosyltransferase [Phaeodactylibacter sp.]|nr:glycosyltransferase [Phaeodactylibacter sp.]